MPTGNRSSNTEMVSVSTLLAADSDREMLEYLAEAVDTQTYVCDQCGHEEPLSTFDIASDLRDYMLAFPQAPAPQPHPEPIAWMVGTAFWWTKEEAERDAAATGLPIVGLGPMTTIVPAEQHQGEPVAWRGINDLGEVVTEWIDGVPPESIVDLCGNPASFAKIEQAYTHADLGEVERLRIALGNTQALLDQANYHKAQRGETIDTLRAQLAEAHGLLRKIEGYHWAKVEPEERARTRAELRDLLSASDEPQVKS